MDMNWPTCQIELVIRTLLVGLMLLCIGICSGSCTNKGSGGKEDGSRGDSESTGEDCGVKSCTGEAVSGGWYDVGLLLSNLQCCKYGCSAVETEFVEKGVGVAMEVATCMVDGKPTAIKSSPECFDEGGTPMIALEACVIPAFAPKSDFAGNYCCDSVPADVCDKVVACAEGTGLLDAVGAAGGGAPSECPKQEDCVDYSEWADFGSREGPD
jgi:hypothetical protein